MKKLITLSLLSVMVTMAVNAQTAEQEVQSVIETMFDGMRAGDSSMVASAFIRGAKMETVAKNREGNVVKSEGSLSNFLIQLGTPHEQIWDERISSYDIKIDGDLASAWTPYQFYVGDKFSHCGVNSFQLAKLEGNWKIIYIVDTRRRTECAE